METKNFKEILKKIQLLSENNFLKDKSVNNKNKMEINNSDKEIKLENKKNESYIINKIL